MFKDLLKLKENDLMQEAWNLVRCSLAEGAKAARNATPEGLWVGHCRTVIPTAAFLRGASAGERQPPHDAVRPVPDGGGRLRLHLHRRPQAQGARGVHLH